jgi:hypothetical protein
MSDSKFWDVTVPWVMSAYASAIFLLLWVGFITALVVNREWLDIVWHWAQALSTGPRIAVWVFFLPITVGLWIWESPWSVFGHLLGLGGIVTWTFLAINSLIKVFR